MTLGLETGAGTGTPGLERAQVRRGNGKGFSGASERKRLVGHGRAGSLRVGASLDGKRSG